MASFQLPSASLVSWNTVPPPKLVWPPTSVVPKRLPDASITKVPHPGVYPPCRCYRNMKNPALHPPDVRRSSYTVPTPYAPPPSSCRRGCPQRPELLRHRLRPRRRFDESVKNGFVPAVAARRQFEGSSSVPSRTPAFGFVPTDCHSYPSPNQPWARRRRRYGHRRHKSPSPSNRPIRQ